MELVKIENGIATASTLQIAENFGKRHTDVIRKVETVECSEEFRLRNFALSSYTNAQNKEQRSYELTRDGFAYLVMGFTGKSAAIWKEKYIAAFNDLEARVNVSTPQTPSFLSALQNLNAQNAQILEGISQTYTMAAEALARVERIEAERAAIADDIHGLEQPSVTVPARTTRANLVLVVNDLARLSGLSHQAVWRELYTDFKSRTHIDLRTRAKNFNAKSILDYAEANNHIDGLYSIAYEKIQQYGSTAIAKRGN